MVIGYFNACEIETKQKKGVTYMSLQKNGASLKGTFSKAVAFSAALLTLTGSVGSLSAAYDPCCPPEPYCPAPAWDPCACEMPDLVIYADFLYWQVHPEGLEFVRSGGFSPSAISTIDQTGSIVSPSCELEPGFRVGMIVDLGCCNWDFYAQYTWLHQCFGDTLTAENHPDLQPLIYNQAIGQNQFVFDPSIEEQVGLGPLSLASAQYDATFNVLDFGLGRTFAVNNCFDFRPHLGFKATWQDIKYDVRYARDAVLNDAGTDELVPAQTVDIHNKTDFDGIGLRSGFDAKWRFSPCFSVVGGVAVSAVWSDICTYRQDTLTQNETATKNIDLKQDTCALIPVTELLLGLQYDTTWCDTDIFVFVGWENQVWWNLNRFIYIENSTLLSPILEPDVVPANVGTNNIQFGPHGNVTYQGLTVRAGFGF